MITKSFLLDIQTRNLLVQSNVLQFSAVCSHIQNVCHWFIYFLHISFCSDFRFQSLIFGAKISLLWHKCMNTTTLLRKCIGCSTKISLMLCPRYFYIRNRNTLPLTLNAIGGYPDCPLAEEGEEAKRGKEVNKYVQNTATFIKLLNTQWPLRLKKGPHLFLEEVSNFHFLEDWRMCTFRIKFQVFKVLEYRESKRTLKRKKGPWWRFLHML